MFFNTDDVIVNESAKGSGRSSVDIHAVSDLKTFCFVCEKN